MAAANPIWRRWLSRLWTSAKAQPLATALLIPLALLGLQVYAQRQDATSARQHAALDAQLLQVRSSGKDLDAAIASYYDAIGELGLAKRNLESPGAYSVKTIATAQSDVVETRKSAQKALSQHAADVHGLGDLSGSAEARSYMSELDNVSEIVDGQSSIEQTGSNTTALSRLIMARDALMASVAKRS